MQNTHKLHEAQFRSRLITRHVRPASLEDALVVLAEAGPKARAVAGGTDLVLEMSRGRWPDLDTLVDLSALAGLSTITVRDGRVQLGATVTHSDVVGCDLMRSAGLPLAQACLEVGSPQLRNHATVAGNVVTASPANDTLSALYALGASVTVASAADGERTMPIADFVTGYRATALRYGELVTRISFDALHDSRRGVFVKLGLRRAQAISVVHAAVVVNTESAGTGSGLVVTDLVVALGSVGPTVEFVADAAEIARGRRLDDLRLAGDVAAAAQRSVSPMSDLRSSAEYRRHAVGVAVRRALLTLAAGTETAAWPCNPPRLAVDSGRGDDRSANDNDDGRVSVVFTDESCVTARVNGVERRAANTASRTLLEWLRADLGLTGVKEGCAEGECGACTVHVNGRAVLACLLPAARADGADVVTVEGVSLPGELHPVQQALADSGGVQCGFCTPGFVMSAAMLAAENPNPDRAQVEQALSGNLCRCTGYYPIIRAIVSEQVAAPTQATVPEQAETSEQATVPDERSPTAS